MVFRRENGRGALTAWQASIFLAKQAGVSEADIAEAGRVDSANHHCFSQDFVRKFSCWAPNLPDWHPALRVRGAFLGDCGQESQEFQGLVRTEQPY